MDMNGNVDKSVKDAKMWIILCVIVLAGVLIFSLKNNINEASVEDIYTITGVDISKAANSEDPDSALSQFAKSQQGMDFQITRNDVYIKQYQNAKFKKVNKVDTNNADDRKIYFYDSKKKIIFTLIEADVSNGYYYLIPGKFTTYDGLQLYKIVE